MASFKLDEGFSEAPGLIDTLEIDGSLGPRSITKAAVEEWIMAQDEIARRGLWTQQLPRLSGSFLLTPPF